MEKATTNASGRFRPAEDRFSQIVYGAVALTALAELFAIFWLELV